MAWETRRGRKYYYRKVREGNRVRSIYVGADENACLVAEVDAKCRQSYTDEHAAARRVREFHDQVDDQINQILSITEILTEGALMAAGFHTRKREWRRVRYEKSNSE
jgi:hypothetical protein